MGKGDRRSRRGKIWRGTSGKYRPQMKKETPEIKEKEVKEVKVQSVRKVIKRGKGT